MSEDCTQPTLLAEWAWLGCDRLYELDPKAPNGCNEAGIFYGIICDNCGVRAGKHFGNAWNMECHNKKTHFKPRLR